MGVVYQKLTDTAVFSDDPEAQIPSAAYAYPVQYKSPLGRCVAMGDYHDIWTLVETSAPTASLIWTARLTHEEYLSVLGDTLVGFALKCIDDDGDMWGGTGMADGNLVMVPKSDHVPVGAYTWEIRGGDADELSVSDHTFTFQMPDNSIFVLMVTAATGHSGQAWISDHSSRGGRLLTLWGYKWGNN